jgi:hypothetical protein
VVDEVDRLLDRDELGQVLVDELELVLADVLDVLERPRVEVVDADHAVAALQQVLAQVRAQKAGASCDQASWHLEASPHP